MILRKKQCSIKLCGLGIVVVILFINLLFYYFLEIWSVNVPYYDPFTNNAEKAKATTLPTEIVRAKKPSQQKHKYVSAQEHGDTASAKAAHRIQLAKADVIGLYNTSAMDHMDVLNRVLSALNYEAAGNLSLIEKWVSGTEVVPATAPGLGSMLKTLCSLKIVKADNSKKGTQLKLQLTLEGGFTALFKPQWYGRGTVIHGPVYAGKDRHNAEVAAFHLSLLLGMRRVPLTVGRRVNLRREVMPVATPALLKTFFQVII